MMLAMRHGCGLLCFTGLFPTHTAVFTDNISWFFKKAIAAGYNKTLR